MSLGSVARLVLLVLAAPAVLAACTWEKGKIGGPAFKRSSTQVKLRASAGVQQDAGIEFELEDASLTKISTALGLDECSYAFRMRLKNLSTESSQRFRRTAVRMLDTRGRSLTLSGPLGCGDGTLESGQQCSATFYTHVRPHDCGDPAALLLGEARLTVTL